MRHREPRAASYVLQPGVLVADIGLFKGCLWVEFSNKPGHTSSPGTGTNKPFINPPPQTSATRNNSSEHQGMCSVNMIDVSPMMIQKDQHKDMYHYFLRSELMT